MSVKYLEYITYYPGCSDSVLFCREQVADLLTLMVACPYTLY